MKIIENLCAGRIRIREDIQPLLMRDGYANELSQLVRRSTKVDATNVAQFWAGSSQQVWDLKDYPCCAPPWDLFTVFWREPPVSEWNTAGRELPEPLGQETESAFLAKATETAGLTRERVRQLVGLNGQLEVPLMESKWLIEGEYFLQIHGVPRFWPARFYAFVRGDGRLIHHAAAPYAHGWGDALQHAMATMGPLYLAVSFANCRNVTQGEHVIEKRGAKFKKRSRCPRITYKTLEIDGQKKVMAEAVEESGGSIQKALHICRGHFATYTDEAPMFGKHTGTFWVPMHTRGKRSQGRVIKDYHVKGSNHQ